jgi:phosphatidylserine/phosphatidylglycerophosphate/cardiolipin synthase-like enzyme
MRFATRETINEGLYQILRNSKRQIFIVTPYIKLHEEIKNELKRLEKKDKVHVRILFGKNSDEKFKSLSLSDLEFLKKIRNIDIRFEETLHAKFYCNEKTGILTSMNLHSYSQNNNIETGVVFRSSDKVYKEAIQYFDKVFFNAEWYYSRTPLYKKIFFGLFKKYISSEEIINFKEPTKLTSISGRQGYCIRTGIKIPLNHKMPFHYKSYKVWAKTNNPLFPENYCHFTGNKSFGKTNFKNPVLTTEWGEYYRLFKDSSFSEKTKI